VQPLADDSVPVMGMHERQVASIGFADISLLGHVFFSIPNRKSKIYKILFLKPKPA
jgi:hypothetical protein